MANPGPSTTVTANYLFNGDASNGVLLGGSATNLVGFHGATPVAQASAITAITNTATGTEIATAVNAIITALKNKGLTA
jgi:homospermidine synthase